MSFFCQLIQETLMNRFFSSTVAASKWGLQVSTGVHRGYSAVRATSSTSAKSSIFEDFQKPPFSNNDSQNKHKPYQNLFPWKDEVQLAKLLIANIVFVDRGLVAINKPFGLGMHVADQKISTAGGNKLDRAVNKEMLSSEIVGSPRYCLSEVLDYMAQLLNVRQLSIVKSAHRDWSGIVLLSTGPKSDEVIRLIEKAGNRARCALAPHMRFYAITSGIITSGVNGSGTELCGLRLLQLDDQGIYKEPVYVPPEKMSKNLRKAGLSHRNQNSVKPFNVNYRTVATNRQLAVSLVELSTSATKWSFVQCFLAYKAAFVLGDLFFSRRVKHLLGQPVVITPKKQVPAAELRLQLDNYYSGGGMEPLSRKLQQALGVRRNAQLPLMIHCAGLTLPGLRRSLLSTKMENVVLPKEENDGTLGRPENDDPVHEKDIIITADQLHQLPDHFRYTLERLALNLNVPNKSST